MSRKAQLLAGVLSLSLLAACSSAPTTAPGAPTAAPAAQSAAVPRPTESSGSAASAPSKPEVSKPAIAPEAPKPAAAPEAPKPAPAAPAATTANPKDALVKSYAAMAAVKSFRARALTTGLPGGDSEMRMEVVLPNRVHAVNERSEMIVIGSDAYLKMPDGWQKFATGLDIDFADPKKMEAALNVSTETKLVGPDLLDGTPVLVYEYSSRFADTAGPAAKADTTYQARAWIAVADNLPRKLESADPASAARTTITYFDYNAPITINPPA